MVRFSISVAILDMIQSQNSSTPTIDNSSCPVSNMTYEINEFYSTKNKFNWTTAEVAQIEASFFYGYAAGVGPMGVFADLIG